MLFMLRPLPALRVARLLAKAFNKGGNVFGSPDGSAGAELDGFWVTSGTTAFPPCAFADGDDGQHLTDAQ